jgi:hypothetical protein
MYIALHMAVNFRNTMSEEYIHIETKEQFRNDRAIQNDASYRTSRESSLRQIELSSVNNVR